MCLVTEHPHSHTWCIKFSNNSETILFHVSTTTNKCSTGIVVEVYLTSQLTNVLCSLSPAPAPRCGFDHSRLWLLQTQFMPISCKSVRGLSRNCNSYFITLDIFAFYYFDVATLKCTATFGNVSVFRLAKFHRKLQTFFWVDKERNEKVRKHAIWAELKLR